MGATAWPTARRTCWGKLRRVGEETGAGVGVAAGVSPSVGMSPINVGRAPNDRSLIEALTATLLSVFPSVHIMDVPNSFNSILYATVQPTDISNLSANRLRLLQTKANPLILLAVQTAVDNLQPTPSGGVVFTDDRAAIEWITNNMIIRFFLTGEEKMLQ